jgi:nucleotide-binding universal stress UspA family protein
MGGGAAAASLAEHRIAVTRERIEGEIANFQRACEKADIQYVVDRETGDAFDLLHKLWRYHDLTVIGLRGLFEYGVVQNPDDQLIRLIRHGVRPILAVSSEYRQMERVLIAFNGSSESAMAMKRFAQICLWKGIAVRICCFGFDDEKALPLLTDAVSYLRAHGYDPESGSMPGYPDGGLLKHATHWNADLVVMGSSSRSRIKKLMLGETALEALLNAGMPLFLSQ